MSEKILGSLDEVAEMDEETRGRLNNLLDACGGPQIVAKISAPHKCHLVFVDTGHHYSVFECDACGAAWKQFTPRIRSVLLGKIIAPLSEGATRTAIYRESA